MRVAIAAVALVAGCGGVIHGSVFVDRDRDGVRDPDEPGAPGVRVFFESTDRARTDDAGNYILPTSWTQGVVWAWTPEGYRPGASFAQLRDEEGETVDIPLTPFAGPRADTPWAFVVASDSHTVVPDERRWDGGDLSAAVAQMLVPAPRVPTFFTILGDISQDATDAQFDLIDAAISQTAVPFVGVTGNHDLYDEGPWRRRYGPDAYGFDVGGLRFVVWNGFVNDLEQLELFHLALDGEDPDKHIVGLGHASPRDLVVEQLARLGVDTLFTGHWHANRRVDRFGVVEWATEPLIMGGLDHGPSGYRIITVDGGRITTASRRTMLQPVLALVQPVDCAPPGPVAVVAVAALDAGSPIVTAAWSDRRDDAVTLRATGGWTFTGTLPPRDGGAHELVLEATTPGTTRTARVAIAGCARPPAPTRMAGNWSQIQGGPHHAGAVPASRLGLAPIWTVAVGGHVLGGSPIVAGDTAYITVSDLADGDAGGVVALDLATGRERWRFVTAHPARGAVAVARGVVVVTDAGGTVHAVDAATGRERWRRDMTGGTTSWTWHMWQPPLIADGAVIVGTQATLARLDLMTGEPAWTQRFTREWSWLGPTGAPTAVGDRVLFARDRESGLWLGDRATGAEAVRIESIDFVGIAGAPVDAGDRIFIGNTAGAVLALDPATLGLWWRTPLVDNGDLWTESIIGSLATAGGRVFVGTQAGEVVALGAETGTVLWRTPLPPGPINLAHYASDGRAVGASPVVTGEVVWIGGVDGVLRALDVATGRERERHVLGSPILAGAAPVRRGLVVATFGGTVHLLAGPASAAPEPGFPWGVFPAGLLGLGVVVGVARLIARRRAP